MREAWEREATDAIVLEGVEDVRAGAQPRVADGGGGRFAVDALLEVPPQAGLMPSAA